MEAEKCHDLLFTSRRHRTAGGAGIGPCPKAWEPAALWCKSLSRGRGRLMSQVSQAGREREFNLPPPFCSVQDLIRLDDAHIPWGGWSALLSSPNQMLISSRNTLTDIPTNNVYPDIRTPFGSASRHLKWTIWGTTNRTIQRAQCRHLGGVIWAREQVGSCGPYSSVVRMFFPAAHRFGGVLPFSEPPGSMTLLAHTKKDRTAYLGAWTTSAKRCYSV